MQLVGVKSHHITVENAGQYRSSMYDRVVRDLAYGFLSPTTFGKPTTEYCYIEAYKADNEEDEKPDWQEVLPLVPQLNEEILEYFNRLMEAYYMGTLVIYRDEVATVMHFVNE